MKFDFKKMTSVLASVAMIGATIGIASAASYPSPFVKNGVADIGIVIGASASTLDNIAAVDIASNLQAELSKQTAISNLPNPIYSGESINLASATKLYYNSKLNDARPTLTKAELPTLLSNGKVIDDSGTEYSYEQTIKVGGKLISYSTSGGDFDSPALLLEVGTDASSELYQYVLTFNKNLDIVSDDIQGNSISILGKEYTISSDSTSSKLVLFGAGTGNTIKEGATSSVKIGTKTYSIEVKSIEQISGINYVSLSIDGGNTRRIAEGNSAKVGDIEVYAKGIHYLAKESQVSYADLSLGTTKITLPHGSSVKLGGDDTSIYGTSVNIGTSSGDISSLKINVTMTKATKDFIKVGESFTDPVFGSIKTQFISVTPELDSSAREIIKINTDNSRNAKVTFTSALAGDSGETVFFFAHDDNEADSAVNILLSDTANKTIHVVEGESINLNEYALINSGDYGRIIKLTEVPSGELSSSSEIQFEDVITGKNLFDGGLTVGIDGKASTNIDGQTYYFNAYNSTIAGQDTVSITYGTGASENNVGTQTTIYPRIKLSKGGWLSILKPVTINSSLTYSLPGIEDLATYESGVKNDTLVSIKSGNINYTIGSNIIKSIGDCVFGDPTVNGAAILFLEEKKSTESGNSNNGDAICVNVDTSGTTEISVAKSVVTGISSTLISSSDDSNKQRAVTRYGSYIEYDSNDNDAVNILYPNEQMIADVVISATEAEVLTNVGSVTELGSIAVLDSEIDAVSSKNLIVIGGSCINSVAAKLLGSNIPICGSDFTTKTGISNGQFLIKVLDSPYATGKVAMLVAGYEGADTRKAVTYVTANKPATTVGTALKKSTSTYADIV